MARERSIGSPTGGWDWPALLGLALREARVVLPEGADAEDAAQAAVLRAWRHQASCLEPTAPGPWVRSIARREAIRVAGRRTRERWDDLHDEHLVPPEEPDPLRSVDVRRALATLGPQDREIFLRHYWSDESCRQTAAALGMPEATVKVRLHRGRRRLRPELEEGVEGERRRANAQDDSSIAG